MEYPESRFPLSLQDWLDNELSFEITWNQATVQPESAVHGAISINSTRPYPHLPRRDYVIDFTFKLNRSDWEQGRIELEDKVIEIENSLEKLRLQGLTITLPQTTVFQVFLGLEESRSSGIIQISADGGGLLKMSFQYKWDDNRGIGRLKHY